VLEQILVRDAASMGGAVTLRGSQPVAQARAWIESGAPGTQHQGFPIVGDNGVLRGVLTRRDLLNAHAHAAAPLEKLIKRPPKFVYDDVTLRDAADHMVNHDIGRLPVVSRDDPRQILGMLTRSDVLRANRKRLHETRHVERIISWKPSGDGA
jgi:chloride channel protein, CIC family